MSTNPFRQATKVRAKLRLALIGPSGSGKTYTALTLAQRLAGTGRVAVLDTERGSASLYADLFPFDVLELQSFHPRQYIDALECAAEAGYGVVVIDSLSHAWMGKDGALELVDNAAKRSQSGNNFTAWREVTPLHNALVDALNSAPLHVIATMRAKTEYVQEKDDRGKTVIRKVGLAPVQRDGLEYEFTVVADMDTDNTLIVSKSRIPVIAGQVIRKPDAKLADTLLTWLDAGAEPDPKASSAGSAGNTVTSAVPNGSAPMPAAMATFESARRMFAPDPDEIYEPDADPLDDDRARRAFWQNATELGYVNDAGKLKKSAVHRAFGVAEADGALGEYLEAEHRGWAWAKRELIRITEQNRAAEQTGLDGMPPPERVRPENAVGVH